jgi:iron(III) transport system ATP-binding protein
MLEISDVRKSLGGTSVLRGASLTVDRGALTAVLGASGAGKTTLLRVIAGFERADAGIVRLEGAVVDGGSGRPVPPERRRIGYVPQDGALFPHLTVRQNVAFGLPRARRGGSAVEDLLNMVGLEDLGHRYPGELSGGQRQRVAIARAIAPSPRLVLLDEPFASLDASLRASVRADVLDVLRRTGTAGVLVTHDQDEALSAADRVAVLRDGVIVQDGPPRRVYECPADPWTASFLGVANLLAGDPSGDTGRVHTVLGWHDVREEATVGDGRLTVMVRPEQILLSTGSAPATAVAGTIREASYHGHDALVEVSLPEAGSVRIRTLGTSYYKPGEEVSLQVEGPVMAWPCVTS